MNPDHFPTAKSRHLLHNIRVMATQTNDRNGCTNVHGEMLQTPLQHYLPRTNQSCSRICIVEFKVGTVERIDTYGAVIIWGSVSNVWFPGYNHYVSTHTLQIREINHLA